MGGGACRAFRAVVAAGMHARRSLVVARRAVRGEMCAFSLPAAAQRVMKRCDHGAHYGFCQIDARRVGVSASWAW